MILTVSQISFHDRFLLALCNTQKSFEILLITIEIA